LVIGLLGISVLYALPHALATVRDRAKCLTFVRASALSVCFAAFMRSQVISPDCKMLYELGKRSIAHGTLADSDRDR